MGISQSAVRQKIRGGAVLDLLPKLPEEVHQRSLRQPAIYLQSQLQHGEEDREGAESFHAVPDGIVLFIGHPCLWHEHEEQKVESHQHQRHVEHLN